MSPFEAIGETARWRLIYNLLCQRNIGDILTYDTMADALDLHADDDRHAIQMAVRRAAKEYEEVNLRALEAVPNKGYRIVEPKEHMRLARRQQRKSRHALQSGHSKVVNVDLTGVDPEVRKAFEVTALGLSQLLDYSRRLDVGQRQLTQAVEAITERSDRSESEIEALRKRLERLERERGDES